MRLGGGESEIRERSQEAVREVEGKEGLRSWTQLGQVEVARNDHVQHLLQRSS